METLVKFREWLEEEIEAIKGSRNEDNMFVCGKLSEVLRIRAMLCRIDKENKKNDN